MRMKIDRLIGIIMILLQRDKATAAELAERFEVSARTINRDVEDICKAGLPLVTVQGYRGGISFAEGYKIDKTFFTREELQSILTGLKGIDSISEEAYFFRLIDKLSDRGNRVEADDVITIDLASHYQGPLMQKIARIKEAILSKRLVAFQYYSEKGESERRIEPYRLIFRWSSWYMFGYCLEKAAYRLFKLNRLWKLQLLNEPFSPRELSQAEVSFDDYFSSNVIHLKAIFAESEKYRLIDEYGIDCYTDCGSGLLLERDFASYENMRQWIFSFGDKVEILSPSELIDDRIKQAEKIIGQNQKNRS